MSPRENNQLMAAMMSRAASVTFDPIIPAHRAQFNPATGSWVFGLAAFAAGVAINRMIHSESGETPSPDKRSRSSEQPRLKQAPAPSKGYSALKRGSMKDLLHDTMAEESKSGEYLNSIGSEVAKLRAEVAALSAQREQIKYEQDHSHDVAASHEPSIASQQDVWSPAPPVSQEAPAEALKQEFEVVRETLSKLNAEKAKLVETEQELNKVLAEQQLNGANNNDFRTELNQVQNELEALHSEQSEMQSQYLETKREANDTQAAMEQLKLMLNEKIAKLHEAEAREKALRNDHKVLMETVESLKTQLEFFRKQASQDQSGVTSLKILEESNSKLVEQIKESQVEAEQQQAGLQKLAAEKSELDKKLAQYQDLARANHMRMQQLEEALQHAKNVEQKLLQEVERLSNNQQADVYTDVDGKVAQLERELQSARASISDLEQNENDLLQRLTAAEQVSTSDISESSPLLQQVTSERDELQNTLSEIEQRNSDVKTDLVIAAEKEEELNSQISVLLGNISSLENERDLYKSKAEIDQLKVTNASNEYQALKQSILTLESEKGALARELEEYQRITKIAKDREASALEKVRGSENQERYLTSEINRLTQGIDSNEQNKREYIEQQRALQEAESEIRNLLNSRVQKDQELELARREMAQLDSQLKNLTNQAGLLAQDEQNSSKQVSLIHDQLRHRDNAIAEARVKEENLKREINALQQTTASLHGEVNRLQSIQQDFGASSASLDVLRDTESQLVAQLEQAKEMIQQQNQELVQSEQEKAQLELQHRDESNKLANLRKENEELRNSLTQWQAQETAYSSKIAGLSNETQRYQDLENEYKALRTQNMTIKSDIP